MGGILVCKKRTKSLVDQLIEKYNNSVQLCIAITPVGTRSKVSQWHTGFIHIARKAQIPILLGKLDFKNKCISVEDEFLVTGNVELDMQSVKNYYKNANACYPEKFCAD